MFRKLFGKDTPKLAPPALPVVRNVTIGRTVILDPLTWRRFGSDTKFALDRDTLEITAQGVIALDDGAFVHRFYTDDHVMLQAVSDDREGQSANDFTLFTPWRSAYPGTSAQGRIWADKLRSPVFMEDDLPVYRRFWFDEETPEQAPVTFWENVFEDRAALETYARLFQTCMLFHRDLPDEGRELLLALTLEPEKGDVTQEIMIGLPLAVGEFKA
ncbi:DUF2491 family protein [Phenylobacterium sp.]|uniref:DUF2491 family protein n=1 Tax=Phenylobacterium sp. TaxID=1871053 RepID=UPI00286C933E|nr:DUF2491 family protein [Phenylobacterium sp.]